MAGRKVFIEKILVLVVAGLSVLVAGELSAAERRPLPSGTQLQLRLPDLIVVGCRQARGCRVVCRFKNNGSGSIPDAQHAKAKAHISAGMKNPPIKNPIPLKKIDPTGKLKAPGGSVDYDTGCVATAADMGLVWIDTDHHITESNETNNGANPTLKKCLP